jgi:hypothetical protein
MKKELRQQQAVRRKNFLPTLLVTIFLWLLVAGIIYFIDPHTFGVLPLFFVLILIAFLFSFSIIFSHTRRGFLAALGLTLFIILRYFGVGNILNLLLISGVIIALEIYFTRK